MTNLKKQRLLENILTARKKLEAAGMSCSSDHGNGRFIYRCVNHRVYVAFGGPDYNCHIILFEGEKATPYQRIECATMDDAITQAIALSKLCKIT